MTQNDPKSNGRVASVLPRLSLAGAFGLGLFALGAAPLSAPASAEGWQVTSHYYGGGYGGFGSWTKTYRRIGAANDGIHDLKDGAAPGNRCAVPAFEVLNPAPGEPRCVGAIYAWR